MDLPGRTVRCVQGEPIEAALRRLKRLLGRDGMPQDIARHQYYLKPSVRRRAKRHAERQRLFKSRGSGA